MERVNFMEEFTNTYGVFPRVCFIEDVKYNCSIEFREKYHNNIIGYLQYRYKRVILPFYYRNKKVTTVKTYT